MCQDCLDISEYRFTIPQNCDKKHNKSIGPSTTIYFMTLFLQSYFLCIYIARSNILYK